MNYRALGKSGLNVSEVGLGCEHLQGRDFKTVDTVVGEALDRGMNILDIFMSEPQVRSDLGKALEGRRRNAILQGHIGAGWVDGQYCRVREPEQCKFFFEDFMTRLRTDYVDIGMLHYVDTEEDYQRVFEGGMADYAARLKKEGVIRAVGMSSHDPVSALRAVETGLIDVLMFSINPSYDLVPEDTLLDDLFGTFSYEGLQGVNAVRSALYRACEARGVGITVMKATGAGALLSRERSPFGKAMSVAQCIHYSLTRPGAASVLLGCKTPEEVRIAAGYSDTPDGEKDYSVALSETKNYSLKGKCMYCNHCLPCPSKIDVARVNQFLDLALLGDQIPASVREHYLSLQAKGSDCIACGSCEANCPFGVPVIDRMRRAAEVFEGK